MPASPLGVYIHIPFCRQKCRYCDFYSLPCSDLPGDGCVPEEYIQALLTRLAGYQARPDWRRPATVYFGGGTPSLLRPEQAARLLRALDPLPAAEVTLEANPGTVDEKTLAAFRAAGVNRLSLGVQSASDDSLRRLGRLHTAADSRAALRAATAVGFDNISGDVMLALPNYTQKELRDTLDLLAGGGVSHISCYLLKLEAGTPFGRRPPDGLPDEDAAADFYLQCVEECARRGFAQYEISNFALPGRESRHNLCYWDCQDYLGLGPAAHSCLGGRRFFYPPDLQGFLAGAAPVADGGCTAQDYILLRLRLAAGLDLQELQKRFGGALSARQLAFWDSCVRGGLAKKQGAVLSLTPQGMLVQNSILARLLE